MKDFTKKKEITTGLSGDKKYKCTDENGRNYLLRVSLLADYDSKRKAYNTLKMMNEAKLPVPECIDIEVKYMGISMEMYQMNFGRYSHCILQLVH